MTLVFYSHTPHFKHVSVKYVALLNLCPVLLIDEYMTYLGKTPAFFSLVWHCSNPSPRDGLGSNKGISYHNVPDVDLGKEEMMVYEPNVNFHEFIHFMSAAIMNNYSLLIFPSGQLAMIGCFVKTDSRAVASSFVPFCN